jgi:hypothetical protein
MDYSCQIQKIKSIRIVRLTLDINMYQAHRKNGLSELEEQCHQSHIAKYHLLSQIKVPKEVLHIASRIASGI